MDLRTAVIARTETDWKNSGGSHESVTLLELDRLRYQENLYQKSNLLELVLC